MNALSRWLLPAVLLGASAQLAAGHGHDPPVRVRDSTDLASIVQRQLPVPYRERYNRPRYVGGWIAQQIAPSSQEAMVWHRHVHRGTYARHAPPTRDLYLYPKPWEAMPVGPRSVPQSRPREEIHP